MTDTDGTATEIIERTRHLFEFLQRAQSLKTTAPRTLDAYRREGAVLWLDDCAADHPAVFRAHRGGDPDPDDPILMFDRVPRVDPPEPEGELARWVDGPFDQPDTEPGLRQAIRVAADETNAGDDDTEDDADGSGTGAHGPDNTGYRTIRLADSPEIEAAFRQWLDDWRAWAEQEFHDRVAREQYNELFSLYVRSTNSPEELELVLGTGLLAWRPDRHDPVRRHMLTCPVSIHFDEETARLSVRRSDSPDVLKVELDMLDPGVIRTPDKVNETRDLAREFEAHPLHREEAGALARRLVHTLDSDGEYLDQDTEPAVTGHASAAFAPALILRRRSQRGMVEIFDSIVSQLSDTGEVPEGVVPLVDPDHRPRSATYTGDGARVAVEDEMFLPMPVNDRQREIIQRVDTSAQVLVQGPPGTGKTYTAAALLAHLLAQGKRVLVTAHTDRALREVREKLPDTIKPLAVSVVGSSREDMADLKVAVEQLAMARADYDHADNAGAIQQCLDQIDRLRRERSSLHSKLVSRREREVTEYEHGGYTGSLARIARDHRADADRYGWLAEHVTVGADDPPPLTDDEIGRWHGHLRDDALAADEPESAQRLIETDRLSEPTAFLHAVTTEDRAAAERRPHEELTSHPVFEAVSRLDTDQRDALQQRLRELADEADVLAARREAWIGDALTDVLAGRAGPWQTRGDAVAELIDRAAAPVEALGTLTEVELPEDDTARLAALAESVRGHLADGGKLKTDPDGTPKLGLFAAKVLKSAEPLFDTVRVDGLPPTTVERLDSVLHVAEARKTLTALDRQWPEGVDVPGDDTLAARLEWHRTELDQLRRVLSLADELERESARLDELELPPPDWADLHVVREYADLVDAAAAQDAWTAARQPLLRLEHTLDEVAQWSDAAPCVHALHEAVKQRDHDAYAAAHARLTRLWRVRELATDRDTLRSRLHDAAPALVAAVEADPADDTWRERLGAFERAWAWAATATWLVAQESTDTNALQQRVVTIEDEIHAQVGTLAARRAWDYAASPERLDGTAKADLTQYAQLVKRGGKLSGKYAAQRKTDIRRAMERCRPAVPVWIMPLYRIAEQFRVQPDMFDVVIVDEASQAGLEATFLQYLAPKIVVIGDDKQVSPTAVGVDQQELRDLASQYLAHDRYRASWEDPKRSLFDEAKMRYGGLITLTEHRRCVPEIIGFSNRIAYEPDNIRLVPVRQYGNDRLDPIRAVHVDDGYQAGNKTNPAEAERLVAQVEECLQDPRYDGKTFGVISLLGQQQAKYIQNLLMERIPGSEWSARDLRCGDAADFQGSERDVMFLSMVSVAEEGRRLAALTADMYVQRYNVAVSRAKDQLWVFHSIGLNELHNPEDMRFQLLDYCYGVSNRKEVGAEGTADGGVRPVPEDTPVAPFDSLFEQRVYNRIVDRGYTVLPQYEAAGYRIDLVVLGGQTRLAVECDGDAWHGPEQFEHDLARQRDLERCGWRFFRIPESLFYADPSAVLSGLWDLLRDMGIHPSGREPAAATTSVVDETVVSTSDVSVDTDTVSGPASSSASGTVPANAAPEVVPVPVPVPVPEPETETETDADADTDTDTDTDDGGDARVHGTGTETPRSDTPRTPEPYVEFRGTVASVQAVRGTILAGLREIVAVEGPITGDRLRQVYVRASGGQRLGKQIVSKLNSVISYAVRQGELVRDDPFGRAGVKPAAFRLPEQSPEPVREVGPRSVEEVPVRELAALMRRAADVDRDDDETVLRATLQEFGIGRLYQSTRDQLLPALELTRQRH